MINNKESKEVAVTETIDQDLQAQQTLPHATTVALFTDKHTQATPLPTHTNVLSNTLSEVSAVNTLSEPAKQTDPLPQIREGAVSESVFLEFENFVIKERLAGGVATSKRYWYLRSNWNAAKRILLAFPDYDIFKLARNPELIYNYFERNKVSWSGVAKIILMLNHWGDFNEQKTERVFKRIRIPSGAAKERIRDAFAEKVEASGKQYASKPLTVEMLRLAGIRRMNKPNLRWLQLSLYLGLRPAEVDALHNPKMFEILNINETKVLRVYQAKLTKLPKEKRWKLIPILLSSQKNALQIIEDNLEFKRPTLYMLKKKLGVGVYRYAGRKGFASMLLKKDLGLEAISLLLGHSSVEMTKAHYADPIEVQVARIKRSMQKS